MKLTAPTRVVLVCGVLLFLVVYLAILDLGLHAGKVHRGVSIRGVEVGGLTQPQAQRRLETFGTQLRRTPIVFTTQGYDCRVIPGRVGWRPSPAVTARRAMAVGRSGGVFVAARDRLRSWLGGVNVAWGGGVPVDRVEEFVAECAERGEDFGVNVDEQRLASELARLMETWPRDQLHDLPVRD